MARHVYIVLLNTVKRDLLFVYRVIFLNLQVEINKDTKIKTGSHKHFRKTLLFIYHWSNSNQKVPLCTVFMNEYLIWISSAIVFSKAVSLILNLL